jgi:hypothetical protein
MNYYSKSNPSDVRDLSEQMDAWEASDNPKRHEWVLQPPAPSPDATWQNGQWVLPQPLDRLTLYPSAESYQVRAWMIRGGLDPDLVPAIIAQVVPDGPQRKEALMRWDYAVRIPRDFPLTNVIGAQMGLAPEQIDAAWPEILTL